MCVEIGSLLLSELHAMKPFARRGVITEVLKWTRNHNLALEVSYEVKEVETPKHTSMHSME